MKFLKLVAVVALGTFLVGTSAPSAAYNFRKLAKAAERLETEAVNTQSVNVAARGKLEVAFSPNEGSEHLVVKVIDSATKEILILSYSFTSAPITEALIKASHRGVAVRLVADYKDNVTEDRSGKARAALSALKTAGADVRTIRVYPIHHDKVMIIDRQTVELGSFNYSAAAAQRNSENVLVNWGNPELAAVYVKHFERNYRQSQEYLSQY